MGTWGPRLDLLYKAYFDFDIISTSFMMNFWLLQQQKLGSCTMCMHWTLFSREMEEDYEVSLTWYLHNYGRDFCRHALPLQRHLLPDEMDRVAND
jgi:hypothetical protein